MSNPQMTDDQRVVANEILAEVRERLSAASGGDKNLLFAMRRKVQKELMHDERGKSVQRNKIKALKHTEQNGLCAICAQPLPEKEAVLDRFHAVDGYTVENTQLIHAGCDQKVQAESVVA